MILQDIPSHKYSRIISLVPSLTELLFYLGLETEVAGITRFCIHPQEWFKNKTRVGGTKNVNFKTIDRLSPDLIIANKEENVKEQIERLAGRYDVYVTDVNNLNDATNMIIDIGKLTGRTEKAIALALQVKRNFEKLETISSLKRKTRAAYFIWRDPFMVAGGGTFINDMMNYCGLENVFSNLSRYPAINLQEIKDRNCELILLSSEPYPFKEKHKEEINQQLPAIPILLTDGEMFSWYGSRLLKAAGYFENLLALDKRFILRK